ncbi:PHD finger protein 20 isoform X4 [Mustela putorius furo]|uniref:PHD finger protein 20 isoform X4 n=1 Tax=Mustela putorius furo TaxID=9669 RepID=A0A8U0SCE9_MUSPF|nr:PHD finger protein 20 isoform X4 [Mustela putorius furo]XP_044940078.1 PHD finger protein 20 isoform X4 [Mustela putorius furo]XP_044940079.1 PHD finger protein 20 isoform X4 [Mustela putorius furo]XP_044940080.1 PHD finger protein 20 isoform X4 [Mustela putorius furo]
MSRSLLAGPIVVFTQPKSLLLTRMNIVGNARPKETDHKSLPSSPDKREKFKEQRKATVNVKKDKEDKALKTEKRPKQPDKEGKLICSEKGKVSEKSLPKNEKEDKENISENDREYSGDAQVDKKPENDIVKSPQENLREPKRKRGRPPSIAPTGVDSNSQTLQPITLELRRRKISKGSEVPLKRPRLDKNSSQEKSKTYSENTDKDLSRRRSSRLSTNGTHEILDPDLVVSDLVDTVNIDPLQNTSSSNKESEEGQLKSPLEADQVSSALTCHSFGDGLGAAGLELNCKSMGENSMKTEPASPLAELQEISTVAVTNTFKKTDDFVTCKAPTVDLDHKFRCKVVDCLKFFRKAKLLHYHMKYFHGMEKSPEPEENPGKRHVQTRGSSASDKANQESLTRKRVSASSPTAKDKEKNKEKKFKEFVRVKPKKKKKKKKKTKPECPCSEEISDTSQEPSPPKAFAVTRCGSSNKPGVHMSPQLHGSESGNHKGKVKVSEEDNLSESSSESFLWSDEEYGQDVDVTTNPDEELDGDDRYDFEVVRCICEVQEENDFMIQCEECQCWQHGVCMGLLEENVPEKYTCYVCQDPPGQRPGFKYWYDKEWLSRGHMHGLAFLEENYSHQNAKKIVATHQLLGDVQRVIEVLHGLQLKMSILQSREHPDLQLWCQPWKQHSGEGRSHSKHIHVTEAKSKEEVPSYRTLNGAMEKPLPLALPRSVEESYITSEHCYQKPRAYYPAVEQKLVVETRGSALDDTVNPLRENGDDSLSPRLGWPLDQDRSRGDSDSKSSSLKVREYVSKKVLPEEAPTRKLLDRGGEGLLSSQHQWQFNLLTHVESLQDEVTHRMDSIEKELDVLESWLDYTGELEPPEPLARLPQLKHCIKQLLMDLGKVQQIALCCST